MSSLLSKYCPKSLSDVRGQAAVVKQLQRFAKAPYSTPMLFHGESGIGKTATAHALAHDLGCAADAAEFGGLYEIPSGEMSGQEVRATLRQLAFRPMMGSGWKVLVCNECDRMSASAETIWLDALERLPARAAVVFTTNAPWKLTQRFRDRCECYAFSSDAKVLKPAIKALARAVWKAEVGKGTCPALDILGMPTLGDADRMHASFRLALQQLTHYVRAARDGADAEELADEREQMVRSIGLGEQGQATCDECGHTQPVQLGTAQHTCRQCAATFAIAWE